MCWRGVARVLKWWRFGEAGAVLLSMTHEVCQPFRQPQIYLLLQVALMIPESLAYDEMTIQSTEGCHVTSHGRDMINTVKGDLLRLGKKIKYVGRGQQPAEERLEADLNDGTPAQTNLCERCANIPIIPEDLDKMAMMWRGHKSGNVLGPKHDTCGLWRLCETKDLSLKDCEFCRLLWEI
jgi:hypothetical protein